MEQVTNENAYQIGWYVKQLMEKGLAVRPVVVNGVYTDTVEWRAEDPKGRFVSVRLTIDPEEKV